MTSPLPLLQVDHLVKRFPVAGSHLEVKAVTDVSFVIHRGETLGLVGESGSGKTTVGRCILRLNDVTSGAITFDGQEITHLTGKPLQSIRPHMQMVFQDPHDSLNPRHRVATIIEEPLRLARSGDGPSRTRRVQELLDMVQLGAFGNRFPHQLTGGQAQRVAIARALATNPDLVVLDEPTSALDIAVRADIMNLLITLQRELGTAYLFISHDLTAVRHIADRVAIMYLGQLLEVAAAGQLFAQQLHPYGRALLSSVLYPDPARSPERFILEGEIPSPINVPAACPLHTRCPLALDECARLPIRLTEIQPGHETACTRAIAEHWSSVPQTGDIPLTAALSQTNR